MKNYRRILFNKPILYLTFLLSNVTSYASDIEMADRMRADGMIWVVIAVLCIIFTGILVFLFMIERRLKKLEK